MKKFNKIQEIRFNKNMIRRPIFMKIPERSSCAVISFVLFLLIGAFFLTCRLDCIGSVGSSAEKQFLPCKIPQTPRNKIEVPLNCTAFNHTRKCPTNHPVNLPSDSDRQSPSTCPDYFRWIHEDLRPWAQTGITREMVEGAKETAHFRLVIVDGKVYVEKYKWVFQTRDVFTVWGILQFLRRYPGKVPDLELMFNCGDGPAVRSRDYSGTNETDPPALFHYCGDDATLDIVFPDWSFWGWPEINIKPWVTLLNDIKEGTKKRKWTEREPYAYWKGNPSVSKIRRDLMKCNVSETQDWNARLYAQNWVKESEQGYKESELASQCTHRYKIYIEGAAWSVSRKFILTCDSTTLLVKPRFYEFFTRSLEPNRHYWPVKGNDKCRSIKFAVDWGNTHNQEAQDIGKSASEFIQEELKMDYVYDYMFHMLNEYAKLLNFKPTIPSKAIELCSEAMACTTHDLVKKFMMESMVMGPVDSNPCTMPPPYDSASLHDIVRRNRDLINQVESLEKEYWESQNKQS